MSVPALASYFHGYLTITIRGTLCERFINLCANQEILLWDIKRISKDTVRCKISICAFKRLPTIAYNTGVKIHICVKHGFPFFLKNYKKRKIMLLGVLIFICGVFFVNQFVWDISVSGNYNVPAEKIISVLKDSGLKIGMPVCRIDQQELKKEALIKIPELAWLWVEKKGSKVIVDVREKIKVPEMFSEDDYCNIVAAKDGIIEKMTVLRGVPVVKSGETVLAGTVLVTGKIPVPAKQMDMYIRADANILARVWYEKTEVFSRLSTIRHETGKSKTHYTLNFRDKSIDLFHDGNAPFKEYDVCQKSYTVFGIGFTKSTYDEIVLKEELMSEESVKNFGIKQLMTQLEDEVAPQAKLLNSDFDYRQTDDTTIEVTVRAEYLENIALIQQDTPIGVELE